MANEGNKVQGDVSGIWHNQLGSTMEINLNKDGTSFSGTYSNNAPDSPPLIESLIGSVGSSGSPATLGFTVNFEGGRFTTSWSGQYFNNDGDEVLLTTWLMTANLSDANEYWESTNVGQDRFTRQPQAQKKGRKSLVSQHLAKMAKK
ncbi:avidin-related protein 4/5-like [Montipora foliosa]|uniref:avidin-related protein 4/5-like n=1 Tax=Montipora foliosa TaxID=591990 RepID=UPI0035F18732